MDPTPSELAAALITIGCPAAKSAEMAEQLIKRAHQLATTKGRTFEDAMTHLLRLMAGGWAAQARQGDASQVVEDIAPEIEPWPTLDRKQVGDFRIFSLHTATRRSPRTGKDHDFFMIQCPSWVNVVAVTPHGELVMVEQFRHGTSTIELEIPGGVMDPGEEDPVAAGLRELQEETGYTGKNARLIGTVFPNPAIQSNQCHTVLVEGCERTHELDLDHGEDIAVRLVPVAKVPQLVLQGAIRHSLVVAGLYYYMLQGGK
ncbi:MAG TPA: NUDIX hydrolase [Candidatus Limnocylindria bacterium]|jgi:8-oxo-dGTP pyrophosphatase MutT (NUDIX family)|nr:NUDIX hydrolase [Candidatus Limnocylindria bacterium]